MLFSIRPKGLPWISTVVIELGPSARDFHGYGRHYHSSIRKLPLIFQPDQGLLIRLQSPVGCDINVVIVALKRGEKPFAHGHPEYRPGYETPDITILETPGPGERVSH